jgi:hypothetical protein
VWVEEEKGEEGMSKRIMEKEDKWMRRRRDKRRSGGGGARNSKFCTRIMWRMGLWWVIEIFLNFLFFEEKILTLP